MITPLKAPERNLEVEELLGPQATIRLDARKLAGLTIAAAIALGVVVRMVHVLLSDFPLNDGGLFYAMARDIQEAGYGLPWFTSYNDADIPFSYPPLAFYVAALLDDLTPLSLVDVFRVMPLLATALTLPAFYLLARSLLGSKLAVVASVFAFALIPRSFIWLLMGGGITRSLGLLFAILALYVLHQLYTRRRTELIVPAVLLTALTALSHLETAWFLAFSAALLFVAFGRNRHGLTSSAIVAIGALALTAPWWGTVLDRHGLDPFLAAQATGGSVFSDAETRRQVWIGLARFTSTSEPLFPLIGTLAVLGGLVSLTRRQFLLPVWWSLIILLDVRAFPTFTAVPVAMLAGVGVAELLLPLLNGRPVTLGEEREAAPRVDAAAKRRQEWVPRLVLAALLLYATTSALIRTTGLAGEAPLLVGLSKDERAAMGWVARQTPQDSRILVVPDSGWETAKTAEWFPLLAQRKSVATVQGTEWLPDGEFDHQVSAYHGAYECGYRTADCLDMWSTETGIEFTYVYFARLGSEQCCWTLTSSLNLDPRYQIVYQSKGATIFRRVDKLPAAAPDLAQRP